MISETPLQAYLRSVTKEHNAELALELLTTKYGINVYKHPTLPLVGFKYNQIESPKYDPIVRWSRGTVLEYETWNLVAQGMKRFYNWGESPIEMEMFNWNFFQATGKEDGSLILLYNYNNEWHVNTSGSFGFGTINDTNIIWRDLFWKTFEKQGMRRDILVKGLTYIFELCSPYNKVVRLYTEPKLFHITTFIDDKEIGLPYGEAIGCTPVTTYALNSYEDVVAFIKEKEHTDSTFEGLVLRDNNGIRFKVKTTTYVNLHHLHDNGNIYSLKRLVPIVLKAEQDEVAAVFPELQDKFQVIKGQLDGIYNNLRDLWAFTKDIENQKDFALAIAAHPMKGLLFMVRKVHGKNQTETHLKNLWCDSADLILKYYENVLDK